MRAAEQGEAALSVREHELRTLIDTLPILAWTAAADGSADFFSRPWIDYVGLSGEQAQGAGWAAAFHPADLERVSQYWARLVSTGQPGEIQARLRRHDGVYRWFLFRAAPLLDENGEVLKWYGTNTDIEDQKRAEDELRRSKAYLEHAQKLSRTGSVGFRLTDEKVFWSAETARIYGYDPAVEPTMQMVLARVHPDDTGLLRSVFERAAQPGATFDFEHRLLMPDGSIKHIRNLARSLQDEFGTEEVLGAVTDVTEQHEARRALETALARAQASEAELRTTIDAIPSQVWSALPDGTAEFQNRQWREYTGMWPDRARGIGWHEVIHPDDLAAYAGWWEQTWRTQVPAEAEARFRRADGVYRWFLSRAVALRNDAGRLIKWYGINTDIEELKRAEVELRRSENILAEGEAIGLTGSGRWNLKTGEMVWSAQNCRMLGLDPQTADASLELFLQRVHPDEVEQLARTIERQTAARRPFELGYRAVMPDGAIKHFHTLMRPVVKPSGELDEYLVVSRDVTTAKVADEAVRRSEQVARGQVEALVQSLDVLATSPAPEQLIVQMLRTIGRLLEGQWVALWLLDETRESLVLRASLKGLKTEPAGFDHPFVKDPELWKKDELLSELFFTGVPVSCENMETDARVLPEVRDFFRPHGMKKFLRLPTLVGGEVKGFITICHAESGPYPAADVELAQALAHQAMLAIQTGQAATLEERNRMARDIHDTLAQGFTAVIIQLQAAEDAKSRGLEDEVEQHLRSARELARYSLNEARRSVRALRPQALEDATFWEALKGSIRNTTAGTALQTSFRIIGAAREIPPICQEHLLHIGQEALTNTLKYAHASHFETRLSFTADELRLEFRDDGCGFSISDVHDGSGLLGMRERVAKIGATLDLSSAEDRGTKVLVVLPLTANGFE